MVITYVLTTGTVLAAGRIAVEQWTSRNLTRLNWDQIVAQLQSTPMNEITCVALEYLNPGQTAFRTNAATRLSSLGGIKGVKLLHSNGGLLIALAAQAERWNPEATRSLVKQMRRDGAELRRSAFWLSLHLVDPRSERGTACIQRAAAAYYCMIYRVLGVANEFSPSNLASFSNAVWH